MTIQMEATEKYFHVVLFSIVGKMALDFDRLTFTELLLRDHSNEFFNKQPFIWCRSFVICNKEDILEK